ncbi:MAG: NADH-quinone oxidoreductase subunit NuoE [Candidatus Aminicenantes bacterium]|nr:NADH-quinone oxidoreductase subunit NuoE [Candidatus Aminicenantes bacterium]
MASNYLNIIEPIIKKYDGKKEAIISILQDVQTQLRWLPGDVLALISKKLKIPLSSLYSIATFYKSFYLKPRGENLVTVCLGTACHVRGASLILDELERKLKIKSGETTQDHKITLECVNCVGACALGPIVIVNDDYYGQMTKVKVDKLVDHLLGKKE